MFPLEGGRKRRKNHILAEQINKEIIMSNHYKFKV